MASFIAYLHIIYCLESHHQLANTVG